MKKIFLLSLLLCGILKTTVSQPWMRAPYLNKEKKDVTFNDIRNAFNTYWGDKPYEKGKGYKQFKRWENINKPRYYPDAMLSEFDRFYVAKQNAVKSFKNVYDKTDYSLWTPLGLTEWENGPNGYNPGNGRVNIICVSPFDSLLIFAGAPSGGLWKSIDGGQTWNTTFDDMPQLGVSSIAIHPDSSHIVFIGTGDRDAYDTKCIGIYKSVDGGNTWTPSGINTVNPWNSINKILFNKQNPTVMYAATNYGIYKSSNGGQTWTNKYSGWVSDIVFHPSDTAIIYGAGAQFVRSDDGGNSFTKNTDLPNDTCRLEIAVTLANPDYVYVVSSNANYQYGGLYRSVDAGQTFTLMSDTPNIFGYEMDASDDAGQAWYDLAIAASPLDADEIYVGGINVWKSNDGGATWTICSHWIYEGNLFYTHADIHYLGFYGNRLYCGSDGGVFYSDDAGLSWLDISEGLGITQFYRFSSSPIDANFIVGGTQDNGTNRLQGGMWTHIFGADGMQTLNDPLDINTYYFSYQFGGLMKTTDNGYTVDYIQPNDSIQGEWITPFAMHPLYNNILYAGYEDVYKTSDAGWSWTKISDNLADAGYLYCLKVAESAPDYIYASSNDRLFVSKNDGLSWTEKTIPFSGIVTDIAISYTDPEKIWITVSGANGDRVYKSTDAGQTLTNMTLNINNTGVRCIVHRKNSADALFVGTENAVFYIDSTLTQWQPFFTGLPNVIVSQLEINEQAGKIRAATYGRGIWESALMPLSGIPQHGVEKPFTVYPNPSEGVVKINFSSDQNASVYVFDVNGRHVKSAEKMHKQVMEIDLSNYVSGVYFLRIDIGKDRYLERLILLTK